MSSTERRAADCCFNPEGCERADCREAVEYREWMAWWDALSDKERGEDLYWQAAYANEASQEMRGGLSMSTKSEETAATPCRMAKMSVPGKGTEVVKEGWSYIGTYFEGDYGDANRRPEDRSPKCTLLVTRAQLRRGPSGKVRPAIDRDALEFVDEARMLAWIEAHDAQELPPEAEGNPRYVPEGYR